MISALLLTLLLILFMVASWSIVQWHNKAVEVEDLEEEISKLKKRLKKLRAKNNASRKSSIGATLTKSNPSSISNPIAPPSKQDLANLKTLLRLERGCLQFKNNAIYWVCYEEGKYHWKRVGSLMNLSSILERARTEFHTYT